MRIREEKEKSSGESTAANAAISDEQSTNLSSITFAYPAFANTSPLNLIISFINWCAYSGATRHMTDNREYFAKFVPVTHVWTVKGVGSDHKQLQVKDRGDIIIRCTKNRNMPDSILRDVLYVPGLGATLFSIGAATDLGVIAVFTHQKVYLYRNNQLELVGIRQTNNLYLMEFLAVSTPKVEQGNLSLSSMSIWHRRFGHAHVNVIQKMVAEGSVTGLRFSNTDPDVYPCKGCAPGKSHRRPFSTGRHRAVLVGELIHSDICGPMILPLSVDIATMFNFKTTILVFVSAMLSNREKKFFSVFVFMLLVCALKQVSMFRLFVLTTGENILVLNFLPTLLNMV